MAKFFIDRPIFAIVISIFILLGGFRGINSIALAASENMILQGLILFFVLGGEFFHKYRIRPDFGGEC